MHVWPRDAECACAHLDLDVPQRSEEHRLCTLAQHGDEGEHQVPEHLQSSLSAAAGRRQKEERHQDVTPLGDCLDSPLSFWPRVRRLRQVVPCKMRAARLHTRGARALRRRQDVPLLVVPAAGAAARGVRPVGRPLRLAVPVVHALLRGGGAPHRRAARRSLCCRAGAPRVVLRLRRPEGAQGPRDRVCRLRPLVPLRVQGAVPRRRREGPLRRVRGRGRRRRRRGGGG